MVFITGGAWQGKLAYAKTYWMRQQAGREAAAPRIADGESCTWEEMTQADIVCGMHRWARRQMQTEETEISLPVCLAQAEEKLRVLLQCNPDVILLADELGCGVIPMEEAERRYREFAGRIGCSIAAQAAQVHRVVCGVGEMIKGTDA